MGMYGGTNQYPPQYPTGQYAVPAMTPVRRTIRRVGVGSAFKVSAILSGLIWAIVGLFFVLLSLCGLLGALGTLTRNNDTFNGGGAFAASGAVGVIVIYLLGLLFYTIVGGIFGALYALLYNATSRLVGGLEIEVT